MRDLPRLRGHNYICCKEQGGRAAVEFALVERCVLLWNQGGATKWLVCIWCGYESWGWKLTSFWFDMWVEGASLRVRFHMFFRCEISVERRWGIWSSGWKGCRCGTDHMEDGFIDKGVRLGGEIGYYNGKLLFTYLTMLKNTSKLFKCPSAVNCRILLEPAAINYRGKPRQLTNNAFQLQI